MTQKYGNEWKRKQYQSLKNKGICVDCGKEKTEEGRIRCQSCLNRRSSERRKERLFYIEMGICPVCRKNKIYGDETVCLECKEKKSAYNHQYHETHKKDVDGYHKELYERRKVERICYQCGKRKAAYGRVRCEICLKKNAESASKRRMRLEAITTS